MNAGPELDRLVGQKVMGLRVDRQYVGAPYHLWGPDGRRYSTFGASNEGVAWSGTPFYSTNIGWAWQVVERIVERTKVADQVVSLNHAGGVWSAEVYESGMETLVATATADAAPEAICRLAVALFEPEVPA